MKTNVNMIREISGYSVPQRIGDKYFDANCLLQQWNSVLGNPQRKMDVFLSSYKTREFINALIEEIGLEGKHQKIDFQCDGVNVSLSTKGLFCPLADFQVVKEVKGHNTKNGRVPDQVWMHPYLFIKFAMWINPRFEVKVIKFVYDKMIEYRHEAGDNYNRLGDIIFEHTPEEQIKKGMQMISIRLNKIAFGKHEKGIRDKYPNEEDQKRLAEIEKRVIHAIEDGFIKDTKELFAYMDKLYKNRKDVVFI
jgi:hypothetical protein